ncbi:major facilitator superfamily domain-containing protein [Roridomyces roridus]|uniref:Major facilitator superfamily domain-containing protein n=1 Tax=Roridomyces roridus TaxID=1738132 RepID=A0AAD7BC39_9AGAR|nr:major facilitator superfamily domain-containing protein [Roridomyces roridus]
MSSSPVDEKAASSVVENNKTKARFRAHSLRVGDRITNAAQLTLRETIWPLFLVTILYFLWGFAYGLLDTLNKHFQNTLGITRTRSSGLQAAYFGAYPFAALGYGNWILRHYGYRAVFILGLTLEGIGALCMWPAALKRSFGGFCGATFIIASGLGCLETAANPYMAVTGPPKYAELRINIAQAVQAIGTVIGPVLGSYAFFKDTGDSVDSLKTVQWVYLAIAIFVFCLAVVFFFSVIPEVTDTDMAQQAEMTHAGEDAGAQPFWRQWRVFAAAFAQFCYTGAQVAIAGYFINYVVDTWPTGNLDTVQKSALGAKLLAGAQGCFAAGRFSGSAIMTRIRPRIVFLIYIIGVIIFCSASITQRHSHTGVAMLYMTLFFESVCFPTIVALGIRGLGRHTKRASGWIVAGVVGGACVPPLTAKVADIHNSTAFAMVVPVCFFIATLVYALCCNFVPQFRDVMDRVGDSDSGLRGREGLDEGEKDKDGFVVGVKEV